MATLFEEKVVISAKDASIAKYFYLLRDLQSESESQSTSQLLSNPSEAPMKNFGANPTDLLNNCEGDGQLLLHDVHNHYLSSDTPNLLLRLHTHKCLIIYVIGGIEKEWKKRCTQIDHK